MDIEMSTEMKLVLVTGAAGLIGDPLTESEALGFAHDGTPSRLVVRAMEN